MTKRCFWRIRNPDRDLPCRRLLCSVTFSFIPCRRSVPEFKAGLKMGSSGYTQASRFRIGFSFTSLEQTVQSSFQAGLLTGSRKTLTCTSFAGPEGLCALCGVLHGWEIDWSLRASFGALSKRLRAIPRMHCRGFLFQFSFVALFFSGLSSEAYLQQCAEVFLHFLPWIWQGIT